MNAMTTTMNDGLQWYAVRMVAPGNGHRRTTKLGGDYETYRSKSGQMRKRVIRGTAKRVFVPEHILKRAGFDVFLPIKKVWKRKTRYSAEQELVSYPLMSDWMFVGWSANECRWSDLNALNVVSGVLGAGGKPVVANSDLVRSLRARWGGEMIVGAPKEKRRLAVFCPGDRLKIASGPFEDFSGEVVEIDGAGARVMITLFGRQTPVSVPFECADLVVQAPVDTRNLEVAADKDKLCKRCSGLMVAAFRKHRGHHVRCRDCGGVGAINSESEKHAMWRWNGFK